MATEVATLIARLEADVKRFDRDLKGAEKRLDKLDRTTTETSKRTEKSFARVGTAAKVFLAGAAGAAVVKFGVDSVQAASNLQESMNAVEKTFGPVTEGIEEIGETAAERFGQSQRAFNEFAVRFSAFGKNIAEGTGRDLVDVVDEIGQRVADFASVHNLSLEEASQVAQSTLAGETEVFRRFGGDVSAATVKAKGEIMGFGAELSEQEKQIVRYQLFMEQTENTAGDFADTSEDLANKTRTVKAAIEDAQAEIGEEMLPVLADLLGSVEDAIPLLVKFGKALGVVFRGAAILSANLEGDANRIEVVTGQAADSAGALGGRIIELQRDMEEGGGQTKEFERRLSAFIDEADSAPQSILRVRDGLDVLVEEFGLSEEHAESAARVLESKFIVALEDTHKEAAKTKIEAEQAAEELDGINEAADADRVLKNYAGAVKEIGKEAGTATPSVQDLADAQAAVNNAALAAASPVFGAIDAINRLEEAAEEGNTDFFEMSELTLEAQSRLSELGAGNVQAGIQAIADSMDEPIGQVRTMLEELGILEDGEWSVSLLFDASMSGADRALLNSVNTATSGAGSAVERVVNVSPGLRRQGGGFLDAMQSALVGEAGAEMFVPTQSGSVVPAHSVSLTQNFQRVEGDNIDSDIARGLILSGIERFIESKDLF